MISDKEFVPRLIPGCEVMPIDSSSIEQKYILRINEKTQYEISETLYKLIQHINGERSIESIAKSFSQDIDIDYSINDVLRIIEDYLIPTGVIKDYDEEKISQVSAKRTKSSYLYLNIPIVSQKFIQPITNVLKNLYRPWIFYLSLIFFVIFYFVFFIIFDKPAISFMDIGANELSFVYLLVILTTLFHELGHSSACSYFGAKHGGIGAGIYLYFPVLYADVTDVWKLKRKQRAIVDFGGIYFQLYFVPLYYLLYVVFDNLVFLYSIYAINFLIIVQFNPVLRFDGYWLASDISGIPNLRKRSKEALKYLYKKVVKRNSEKMQHSLHIKPMALLFLFTYSILSNVFFVYIMYHIVNRLSEIIYTYPMLLIDFINSLYVFIFKFQISMFWNSFSQILFPTLILFMFSMMVYRLILRRAILKYCIQKR